MEKPKAPKQLLFTTVEEHKHFLIEQVSKESGKTIEVFPGSDLDQVLTEVAEQLFVQTEAAKILIDEAARRKNRMDVSLGEAN